MYPVRLDVAFTKGHVRKIHLVDGNANAVSPPKNHLWLLLSGVIDHKSLTNSLVYAGKRLKDLTIVEQFFRSTVDSAVANLSVPLFNTAADVKQSIFQLVIIDDEDVLGLNGDPTATADIKVLEWCTQ